MREYRFWLHAFSMFHVWAVFFCVQMQKSSYDCIAGFIWNSIWTGNAFPLAEAKK